MSRSYSFVAAILLLGSLLPSSLVAKDPVLPAPYESDTPAKPKAVTPEKAADQAADAVLKALAPDGKASEPKEPQQIPTMAAAVKMAAADLQTLPQADQPFQRYFFTYDRSNDFYGAFCYTVNTALSSSAVTVPMVDRVAEGWLLRVDLRKIWPTAAVYQALYTEFESLASIDPYLHTAGELEVRGERTETVDVAPYQQDGKTYTKKQQVVPTLEKRTATEHSLHLLGEDKSNAPITALALLTQSQVPVLRADWFMYVALSSDPRDHGMYYRFRRFAKSDNKQSAEQAWLSQQGIDYKSIQTTQSDQRIGKWRSNITGSPRAVEYFFTSSTRPAVGPSATFVTRDWFVGKVDAKRHPLKNLLEYKHDGTEAMGFLPNGMVSFALFDAKGELIDVAPQQLVADRTVPAPHPTNLQTPISCIRCHGSTDMYMDANNDVLALSKGRSGLNIFADLSSKDATTSIDRLAGLYAGEIDDTLQTARNTHAKATFLVTKGMSIPAVATKITEVYKRYRFDPVTPQIACAELGWLVDEASAAEFFNKLLPPLPPNANGISPESVTIGTLRAWTPKNRLHVNRDDWEQDYADAMLRVVTESIRQARETQEEKK